MSLSKEQIAALAEHLENAELNASDVKKITDDYPDMDFRDAYNVQYEIRRRKEARGTRIIGMKMGLTSRAKMEQMGVDTPIYGFLADYFERPESGEISVGDLIHPKVEAEIAFVTKSRLRGPGCNAAQVIAATDFIMPAVEVIDSRYENFRFDLVSVIADNASSSRFFTGGQVLSPLDTDMRTIGVVLEKNGQVMEVGASAAVLGNPATAIAMLANQLAERDEEIPAGSIILSGAITAAIPVEAGDNVTLRAHGMGSVSMRFV